MRKKLSEKGLDLSIFAVLEPIDYQMTLENIIFSDFIFMFISTSIILKQEMAVFSERYFELKTNTENIFDETVNLGEWIKSVASQRVTTNSPFLKMLLEIYLKLVLITSSLTGKEIRSKGFNKSNEL